MGFKINTIIDSITKRTVETPMKEKTEEIIESVNVREVQGVEVWLVQWTALESTSHYNNPTLVRAVQKAKAFLSRQDAEDYVETLEAAADLIQFKTQMNITITKQE